MYQSSRSCRKRPGGTVVSIEIPNSDFEKASSYMPQRSPPCVGHRRLAWFILVGDRRIDNDLEKLGRGPTRHDRIVKIGSGLVCRKVGTRNEAGCWGTRKTDGL